ncbi:hypothetical protein ACFWNT_43455 [Streptomyces sp. NPDC058409]|uniref:hypothetical protein n=1 Tax=Streptomyces sp. NPDC058409 TaxID=3346484 RepID=UPI0036554391
MNGSPLTQVSDFPAEHQTAARHSDPIGRDISRLARDVEELVQEYGHSGALQDSVLHAIGQGLEHLRLHGTLQALARDLEDRAAVVSRLSNDLAGDQSSRAVDRVGAEVHRQVDEVRNIVNSVRA